MDPNFRDGLFELARQAAGDSGGSFKGFLALDDLTGGILGFRSARVEALRLTGRCLELSEQVPDGQEADRLLAMAEAELVKCRALLEASRSGRATPSDAAKAWALEKAAAFATERAGEISDRRARIDALVAARRPWLDASLDPLPEDVESDRWEDALETLAAAGFSFSELAGQVLGLLRESRASAPA